MFQTEKYNEPVIQCLQQLNHLKLNKMEKKFYYIYKLFIIFIGQLYYLCDC